eukprot:s320_g9.t1
MLEAVLTRIILRYAQRYICDTLRTDSLSLWGGDLRVANFELRTEELARVLGTEESSIQLTRGFVRELRVVVPWNAIRSQSLRVEAGDRRATGLPPALGYLGGRLHPASEPSADALPSDVTVTLDHLQQAPTDRRGRRTKHHKALGRALRQVALPILHRVSAEVLLEWPWLPWSQPAPLPPTGRVGFYLSPVRARLAGDQATVQILAQLLSPEVPLRPGSGGWSEGEADSESDRFSLLSGRETVQSHPSVSSRTRSSSGVPVEGKQPKATPDRPGSETSSAPATPSRAAGPAPSKASLLHGTSAKSLPEDETLQEETSPVEGSVLQPRDAATSYESTDTDFAEGTDPEQNGTKNALALHDEKADQREIMSDPGVNADLKRALAAAVQRVVCCSGAAPLLALTLESASPAAEQPAHSQSSVIGTFALIGISAMAVSPAAGDEPLEGSFETHHIAIFVPGASESSAALRWGTALTRSPLEVDDMPSPAVSSSPGPLNAGFTSSHPASGRRDSKSKLGSAAALTRAAAWIEVGRRLLVASAEFPAAASDALGIAGVIAEPVAQLTLSWLLSAKETLQPLLAPSAAPVAPTAAPAPKTEPPGRTQAVVCFSGLRASLDAFGLVLGSARLEWREERAELDEAKVIQGHLPKAAHVDGGALALDVSSASVLHCPGRRMAASDPWERSVADTWHGFHTFSH